MVATIAVVPERLPTYARSVETAVAPRPLPVVTDDLALRFADTLDEPHGSGAFDHIGTPARLLDWAIAAGLLTASERKSLGERAAGAPEDAAAAVQRAQVLRAALHEALPVGEQLDQAWPALLPFTADAAAHVRYRFDDGAVAWWPVADRMDGVLWPVARAAEALLAGPDLARVRRCAGCSWLFVDRSRNGQRRWCDMNDCGRVEKMRRYVEQRSARRRAARAGSADGV